MGGKKAYLSFRINKAPSWISTVEANTASTSKRSNLKQHNRQKNNTNKLNGFSIVYAPYSQEKEPGLCRSVRTLMPSRRKSSLLFNTEASSTFATLKTSSKKKYLAVNKCLNDFCTYPNENVWLGFFMVTQELMRHVIKLEWTKQKCYILETILAYPKKLTILILCIRFMFKKKNYKKKIVVNWNCCLVHIYNYYFFVFSCTCLLLPWWVMSAMFVVLALVFCVWLTIMFIFLTTLLIYSAWQIAEKSVCFHKPDFKYPEELTCSFLLLTEVIGAFPELIYYYASVVSHKKQLG